jgi:glycine oxidase
VKSGFIDLLIVGQGLAGSALAVRALQRGLRILVVDDPTANRSSSVAAGLFNPITGRKMSRTWLADELFPALHDYYPDVERLTDKRFFYPMPMYRPFISVEEQNEWMGVSAEPAYSQYIETVYTRPAFGSAVNDPYGGIVIKGAGYLNTRVYLDSVAGLLREHDAYEQGWFDADALELAPDGVKYRQWTARKVVFCQGVQNEFNPWFRHLPVRPLKGEFLSIQCECPSDVILNRGVYVVPAGMGRWRVGATYNRHDKTEAPTAEARAELLEKLEQLLRLPYQPGEQQWGFRPTTPDRRPLLGAHPEYPALIFFNGLGTKGVSMAPYFSQVLIRWLESEGRIAEETDISRFK